MEEAANKYTAAGRTNFERPLARSPQQRAFSGRSGQQGKWPQTNSTRTLVTNLPRSLTTNQVNRLYAIAYGRRWSRKEVGDAVQHWFHKRDPNELSRMEYDRICQHLLTGGERPPD